jgi:anti-anti-sigma factor
MLDTEGLPTDNREPIHVELRPALATSYAAVVSLCGEHDLATSSDLRVALAPLHGDVLVDLSECEFPDSSAIRTLLDKSQDLKRDGHRLELVVPAENTNVRRIIEIIGLAQLMTVHGRLPRPV